MHSIAGNGLKTLSLPSKALLQGTKWWSPTPLPTRPAARVAVNATLPRLSRFCRALQSLGDLLKGSAAQSNSMSHPDPNAPPNLRPIQVGEVWENPLARERATPSSSFPTRSSSAAQRPSWSLVPASRLMLMRFGCEVCLPSPSATMSSGAGGRPLPVSGALLQNWEGPLVSLQPGSLERRSAVARYLQSGCVLRGAPINGRRDTMSNAQIKKTHGSEGFGW